MGREYSQHVSVRNPFITSRAVGVALRDTARMAGLPASAQQIEMGKRLQQLREASDLSQPALGEIMGAAPNTISSYETGRTRIDILALHRLCDHLKISADWIVLGTLARLPMDIAARIQQAQRAGLGAAVAPRVGRPRKDRTPTVEEAPGWPAEEKPRQLHQAQKGFTTRPKHTM